MTVKYIYKRPAAVILAAAFISFLMSAPLYSDESVVKWDHVPKSGGYMVVIKGEDDKVVVASRTQENFYRITLPTGKYYFRLIVLNILGAEEAVSDWKEFRIEHKIRRPLLFKITLVPAYYYPGGVLAKLAKPGFGGQLNIGFENLFFDNFEAGLSAGLFYLPGIKDRKIKNILTAPLRVYIGYHFRLNDYFSIFPYIGAGVNYSKSSYLNDEFFTSDRVVNPAASAGLSLVLRGESFIFPIGGGASVLYEKEGLVYEYTAYAGIGFTF